jgi:outer membrane lipoprotein LolB
MSWRNLKRVAVCSLLLAAVMLTACATRESRIEGASTVQSASELHDWSAQGRMAVVSSSQSGSGSFNWMQHNADSTVQLRGPVGVGSLQLSLQNEVPHIIASDGMHYDADAALSELQARLGAPIPISQLRYWLRALPAPGDYQWLSTPNKVLQQAGWRIEYGELLKQGNVQLPMRLNATQVDASGGELRIRVVIERWRLQR